MNHDRFQHLQSLLQTVLVVTGAIVLNACSSAKSEGSVGSLISLPNISPSQPAQTKLEVQVRRAGFDGRVQLDLHLPQGASANSVILEPNQDVANFVVTDLPHSNVKATVHVRFAGLELFHSLTLTGAKLLLNLPGGTHAQTVRNINANLDPKAFVTHQVYANFKGSTCQVMVQALTGGLYVCFNDAIRAGKTYTLTTTREVISGTASITYFQSLAASSSRQALSDQAPLGQALWDSVSGSVKVLSVSRSKIEFSINAAKFSPAKGFGKNLAGGEFVLEAATTVTDISNLP